MEKNRTQRGKSYDKDLNIQLAKWMVDNPLSEHKSSNQKFCSGGESRRSWLFRMFKENGLEGKTVETMASKVQFLKKKYLSAKEWSEAIGQEVLNSEGLQTYQDALLKKCPWFYILHNEMDTSQEHNPSYKNNDGAIFDKVEVEVDIDDSAEPVDHIAEAENLSEDENLSIEDVQNNFQSSVKWLENGTPIYFQPHKRKRENSLHTTIMYLQIKKQKQKELDHQLKVDKFQWKKKNVIDQRIHEKEMMQLEIEKMKLQLQIK